MSLAVHHLTRLYGRQRAIEAVSFSVNEGEIVGFLGPNGAGKSTTMKIITGYLMPSGGRVVVGGVDVQDNPVGAKRITGYLPEHNPLYEDMYVREYLFFVGRLYGIRSSRLSGRVSEMVGLCGLSDEQGKKLGMLSKGYKQRVGIAQALIHDPQVLILDEPTSGLDPNQIIAMRKTIKEVSRHKTVLFSTHIMQEVESLCDRVVIIHKGNVIADNRVDDILRDGGYAGALMVRFRERPEQGSLRQIEGVREVVEASDSQFLLHARAGVDLRDALFRYAAEKNYSLLEVKEAAYTMEDVFRELTSERGV